ncbi:hypothetical protein EDD16DRAFT_1672001, partial [Pisolithus croceorrhizus]
TAQSAQGAKSSVNALHPALVAAAHVLPPLLSALASVGATRFLKGVLLVVVGWLALPVSILVFLRSTI